MGGWLGVCIGIAAAASLFWTGHHYLAGLAVATTIASFWSFGIMHNYAIFHDREWRRRIRENLKSEGRTIETIDEEASLRKVPTKLNPNAVPDWLAIISMISSLFSTILLVAAVLLWII